MQITTAGRAITKEGADYLENLEEIRQDEKARLETKPTPVRIELPKIFDTNVDLECAVGNEIIANNI